MTNIYIPSRVSRSINVGRKIWKANAVFSRIETTSLISETPSTSGSRNITPVSPSYIESSCTSLLFDDHIDCQNVMVAEKALCVFECYFCNTFYYNNNELEEHLYIHYTCRFCNAKLNSLYLLNSHLSEVCKVNVIKNSPSLKLCKVDSIQSIVEKYPETFRKSFAQKQIIDEPSSANDDFLECTQIVSTVGENPTIINHNNNSQTVIISSEATVTSELEVICLTEESDDEVEFINEDLPGQGNSLLTNRGSVINHTSVTSAREDITLNTLLSSSESPFSRNNKNARLQPLNVTPNNTLPRLNNNSVKSPSCLNEKERLHSLYTKYSNSLLKTERSTQTSSSKFQIKDVHDVISLDGLISEVIKYKILVCFETSPIVKGKLTKNKESLPVQTPAFEYWGHKNVTDVQISYPTVEQVPVPQASCQTYSRNIAAASSQVNQQTFNNNFNYRMTPIPYNNNNTNTNTMNVNSNISLNQNAIPRQPYRKTFAVNPFTNGGSQNFTTNHTLNSSMHTNQMQTSETMNAGMMHHQLLNTYQNNFVGVPPSNQGNQKMMHINKNITNVNSHGLLAPNVLQQQLPHQTWVQPQQSLLRSPLQQLLQLSRQIQPRPQLQQQQLPQQPQQPALNYPSTTVQHHLPTYSQALQSLQQYPAYRTINNGNRTQPMQTENGPIRVKNVRELNKFY